eukprot:CAMPEP_0201126766 /NCGR_PEP_ID=MMETSP0850-20130426/27340_1 /ASSEMBLY_ACC=CAM_ASM_000622 /TAXON_ID=183588 /ORGANISM="Pseudo-nitzschia fraudulenta, Strain WWA7" /LENGTH=78 /DNA_ID=CAMNT_0047395325 /DNA_START=591 /DNA_END=823 /DNA_ORIENTATION=-
MSTPSKKSVIRRRKNGHFTDNDLSYHTFMCVVHQASIGFKDHAATDTADEDPELDIISFVESFFVEESKIFVIILLCR